MSAISELRAKFTATAEGFKSAIGEVNKGMDDIGESGEKGSKKADGGMGKLKKTVLGFAGAYIGFEAIKGAVGNISAVSQDSSKALNGLQTSTGATDEEMVALNKSMKNVYGNNFGGSFEEIGEVMATVNKTLGLTGEELEKVTESAFLLQDSFGYGVDESVRSSDKLMKQFGMTGEESMALIAEGSQKGLNFADDLLPTIDEYSVYFKQAGLDGQDMFGMFENAKKAGVFNLDYAADAFKEFGINMLDSGSKAGETLDGLGLNGKKLQAEFAKGGDSAKKAFETVSKAVGSIKDPMKQVEVGTALFGTKFEDVGAKGIVAMSKTNDSIKGSTDVLKEMNNIKYNSLGEAFTGIGRQIQVAVLEPVEKHILPALSKFASWIMKNMPQIKNFIGGTFSTIGTIFSTVFAIIAPIAGVLGEIATTLLGWEPFIPLVTGLGVAFGVFYAIQKAGAIQTAIITKATKLWAFAQGALNAIMLMNPIGIIVALIAGLVIGLIMAYKHSDKFREIVKKLWEGIKAGFEGIANYFSTFGEDVKTVFSAMGDSIKNAFEGIMNFFTVTIPAKLESIKDKIMAFTMGIEDKFAGLRDKSTGIIKTLFDFLYNTVFNITNAVMGIFHVFIGLFTGDTAKMKEGIMQIWGALKGQLINIVSTIKDVAVGIIKGFVTGVMFIFNGFKTLAIGAFNLLKSGIVNIITGVKNSVINIITTMKNIVMGIFNAYVAGVKFILNAYKTFFLAVFNAIKTAVIAIVTRLKNGMLNIFNAIKNGVVGAVTSMKNTVVNLAQAIWTSVVGKFNGMKNSAIGSVKALLNGVVGIFNTLVRKAGDVVGSILGKFKGMSLVEVGKDLIRGLWNGITAMGGWIKEKVGGLADSVIGTAKKVFGVKSPSRVFKEIGGFVSEGLALGIEDNSNMSAKATEGMTNDVVSAGVPQMQGGALSGALDFGGLIQAIGNLIQTQAPLVAIDNMSVRDEQDIQKVSRDLQGLIDKSRRSKGYKT